MEMAERGAEEFAICADFYRRVDSEDSEALGPERSTYYGYYTEILT